MPEVREHVKMAENNPKNQGSGTEGTGVGNGGWGKGPRVTVLSNNDETDL